MFIFDLEPGEALAGAEFRRVNVAQAASVTAAIEGLPEDTTLLVNNAGITRDKSLGKMSDDEWQSVLDVNLTGAFNMVRALAPRMRAAGHGRIVNLTSINGLRGQVRSDQLLGGEGRPDRLDQGGGARARRQGSHGERRRAGHGADRDDPGVARRVPRQGPSRGGLAAACPRRGTWPTP